MQFEPFDLLARVTESHGHVRYDLSSSDMPGQTLPSTPDLAGLPLEGDPPGGSRGLRELLAARYGGDPEEYNVTCGASAANFAVFTALLAPGDRVLVERPAYQPLEAIPRALGARVESLVRPASEGFRVDLDRIRRSAQDGLSLLVLTNLHNPSGAALDAALVRGIADLAQDTGFYVLVDEIFRELAFDEEPPTMGGRNDRVLVTSGVGKFFGAGGLRIGWVRASGDARARVRRSLDYLDANAPSPSDRVAQVLLRARDATARRNRTLIQAGRKIVGDWVEATPAVTYEEPPGHICFPAVDADTAALAERLRKDHATFLAPGEAFGLPRHVRLNLGRGPEQLDGGLREVSRALR